MANSTAESSRREFLAQTGALLTVGVTGGWADAVPGPAVLPAPRAPGGPLVIDCHAHVGKSWEAGSIRDLVSPWDTLGDPEGIIAHAREAGIDRTVVFPINDSQYQEANEEVAQICRRYPGHFIGFARHTARTESGRIQELLTHEVRDLGLRGLKLHDQPSKEILDTLVELNIPCLAHLLNMDSWLEFIASYPTVNFIVAHLGSDSSMDYREHLAAIELAKCYPNIHLDTSAVVLTEFLEKAVQELPAEKILLGSDEPEIDCRLEIYKIRVMNLPKAQEEMILGGNMLRLLGGRA